MTTIKCLSESGDFDLSSGNIELISDLDEVMQTSNQTVKQSRGELQYDKEKGISYFQNAFRDDFNAQLFKAEVPGPVADKIRPRINETAKILWMVYVGFTLLQILLLGLAGMPWFDAVCHGFTTMPTGGFSTQNASIAAYSNPVIHYIIIFFMFVAGVNFTLHFRALTGNFKAHVKDYEFRVYLTIIFISTLIIFFNIN